MQYTEAQEAFQNAVSLNPNNFIAQLELGHLEGMMGKGREALPRCFKALELVSQEYGENHPHVALIYNSIGIIYCNVRDYETAFKFHQKALKIRLHVFGDNHSDVDNSYHNINLVYVELGYDKQALEMYRNAFDSDDISDSDDL